MVMPPGGGESCGNYKERKRIIVIGKKNHTVHGVLAQLLGVSPECFVIMTSFLKCYDFCHALVRWKLYPD